MGKDRVDLVVPGIIVVTARCAPKNLDVLGLYYKISNMLQEYEPTLYLFTCH